VACGVDNVYISAVLEQIVINFQRIRQGASRCLTLFAMTTRLNKRGAAIGCGLQHADKSQGLSLAFYMYVYMIAFLYSICKDKNRYTCLHEFECNVELSVIKHVDRLQVVERLKVDGKLLHVSLAGARIDPGSVQRRQVIVKHSRRNQVPCITANKVHAKKEIQS